ncbi:chorismate synthase [Heliomicrobium modesticaldum Ice1]|uniref:Chorismate synthase n=1 Tax=Heliobacterium modesticaldum (strain ATCC 51547 / Ice1) TaxID=498761 RepID=B0TEE6_HELMI|nr:chorismate synthase [Heliomicrobium modesticaldum]ABZ82865.1 chorismate synthase [Heliomicrobium modesticaldum Ice1]
MAALRYLTAGESHGPALTVIVEGMVAGLPLKAEDLDEQLARRQKGHGRGGRMAIEKDRAAILSGIRGGKTLGSPICLQIENRDWKNWSTIMAAGAEADLMGRRVTQPRPGHADLAGAIKYAQRDIRNILERSSARETAARVAAGAVARRFLAELGIGVCSHVTAIGDAAAVGGIIDRTESDWVRLAAQAEQSTVRCADSALEQAMISAIDRAKSAGDSLGGVIELAVLGLPVGVGSHVQSDRRLDGRIAGAMMAIPAIKGVEIGLGFAAALRPGSQVHDEIGYDRESGYGRRTNRAGGIEGGISNGAPVVVRIAMKPIPTLYQPLMTVDIDSRQPVAASVERSDTCAVPAAAVVAEAVLALVVADSLLETTGGDTLAQVRERVAAMREQALRF